MIDEVVKNIAGKTIASELVSEPVPKSNEQIYIERCEALEKLVESLLPEGCFLSYGFSIVDGKETCSIQRKPATIDRKKPVPRYITEEDLKIFEMMGISIKGILDGKYVCGMSSESDNIYIIMTDDNSWKNLCGREWHYNLDTREIKLVRMN